MSWSSRFGRLALGSLGSLAEVLDARVQRRRATRGQRGAELGSQRGIALLIVAVAVAVTTSITTEFATHTNVDWASATNARDDMRSHFLARSGMNLAELVIRVQTDVIDRNRNFLGDIQIADFVGMFMGAFGGEKDELDSIAATIGASGSDLKGVGLDIGTFSVAIADQDSKININCAAGTDQERTNLKTKLEALMYFGVYNTLFENEDAEGYRRDRTQQVAAIIDYVDKNSSQFGVRGAAEDYGYQTLKDRYRAKNNYLDSVGEIKLIRGVDDRFWTIFGDRFTVYGSCKENVASLSDPKQIAAIIFLSAKNPDDPVLRDPSGAKLWMLAQRVSEARGLGIPFDTRQSFADFVKDPDGAVGALFEASGLNAPSAAQGAMVPVEGVELDIQKLQQITEEGPRRIYRVEVHASIDTLEKTIVGVWDKDHVNQNPRGPGYNKGTWVFWREE